MNKESMQSLWASSALEGSSAAYIEALYEQFVNDPTSLNGIDWGRYFSQLLRDNAGQPELSHTEVRQRFLQRAKQPPGGGVAVSVEQACKQAQVWRLIHAYRMMGHQRAQLDPLNRLPHRELPQLDASYYGLTDADMQSEFVVGDFLAVPHSVSLHSLVQALQRIYCGTLGVEYMHIDDGAQTTWLQARFEQQTASYAFSAEKKIAIFERLVAAEGLEKYLATKYVGQKRFGLEGGESLIPALHELVIRANSQGIKDLIIGMAHRGRLNVLVNILGKSPAELCDEFEGKTHEPARGTGDVKYHKGFSSNVVTPTGSMHLALAFNPSHLEIINPVVEGSVRARQERRNDAAREQVLPVLIHGDAAFAGQGIVMETLALSQARGYATGGTLHIIINNQIGFTTSNPVDARSSLYCSDVAKMIGAPIIHVNGDDPEAVVFAVQVALDFRMQFKRDVLLDLVCYRRHGHNEADEPSITQPLMYQAIKKHETTATLYANTLLAQGVLSAEQIKQKIDNYRLALDERRPVVAVAIDNADHQPADWMPYWEGDLDAAVDTAVPQLQLEQIGNALRQLPVGFTLQPQVLREMQAREKMLTGLSALNWGCAETLAYASLVAAGYHVRLSGQDCGRGTFSHRHATLHEQNTDEVYIPLQHVATNQGRFSVINSVLSEAAVLGFEYGYATAEPEALVIWEAQFGDFANGAQVVMDQFMSSGEQKWGRLCHLVLLLPHGYEGQGPEHSSARLERYLQLCAQHNMQVCVPSTPAQIFHLLRRQMLRSVRKPLILMSPKSLLRHKLAVSPLSDLSSSGVQLIIAEIEARDPAKVNRVILCSGKVFYELLEMRSQLQRGNVVLLRIEQLYPFPELELTQQLALYAKAKQVVWCQEEPMNQGAWHFVEGRITQCLFKGQKLSYVGRPDFAAPAEGSALAHKEQQERLLKDALN